MVTLKAETLHLPNGFFQIPFVKSIGKEFGFKGSKLLIEILFAVTETTSFESPYNKAFRERIAKRNEVTERLVDMVVHRMVKNGYLEKKSRDNHQVIAIPSGNIINEGMEENVSLPYFFVNSHLNNISSEETKVNSEEIDIITEEIDKTHNLLPK